MTDNYREQIKQKRNQMFKDRNRLSKFFTDPWLLEFIGKQRNHPYAYDEKLTMKHILVTLITLIFFFLNFC